MLTRDQSFTVINTVIAVLSLALTLAGVAYALASYQQSAVNTTGINAQVRAQRILLGHASSAAHLGVVPGSSGDISRQAAQLALSALRDYKLPEDV